MSAPRIVSVNLGRSRTLRRQPRFRSSIDKVPTAGPVEVHPLGLEGDTVTDHRHHGGEFQAVYAFAQEELDHWAAVLGRPTRPGLFGENLTTAGLDLDACVVGEEWRVGTARFAVSTVRIPCSTFQRWLGIEGFDESGWVRRFTEHGSPGPYLRVLQPGTVTAGDIVEVAAVPEHGVSVGLMFRALTTERALLPRLLEVDVLPPGERRRAEEYVARHGS